MEELRKVLEGHTLGEDEAYRLMGAVMAGRLTPAQVAGMLIGLKVRGEAEAEIAGFARAMREAARPVPLDGVEALDVVGTGGDGKGTLNLSTASALVAAAAGVPVAKHGNRAASSKSGSADVLEALGVPIELSPEAAARMVREVGFAFLFARLYHPAMKHVAPVRTELGVRTVFNLLGPLTNPARPAYFLLGVFDPALLEPMARALAALGVKRALVVHGEGADELVLGENEVVELAGGELRRYRVRAAELGLNPAPLEALAGGDPEENADRIRKILAGEEEGPRADAVALNAGAALYAAGRAESLGAGVERARALLKEGAPARLLDRLVEAGRRTQG